MPNIFDFVYFVELYCEFIMFYVFYTLSPYDVVYFLTSVFEGSMLFVYLCSIGFYIY
jgi:hypothetical protein